jgi:hypothetical protein
MHVEPHNLFSSLNMTQIHPPIEIYAELLLHVGTISLIVTLHSLSTEATTATLSADRDSITVTHDGHSASIKLPTRIKGHSAASLDLPATPAKELTLRLVVEEASVPGASLIRNEDFSLTNRNIPWMSPALNEVSGDLACRNCRQTLVPKDSIKKWKDMPSDNWAEMMDLWHCHKPKEDQNDQAGASKGYSASRSLSVASGIGFVSSSFFLVSPDDCINYMVSYLLDIP